MTHANQTPPPFPLLIVDACRIRREFLAGALAADGRFTADVAEDTGTALTQAQHRAPGVVLVDWQLPDRGAVELARQLRDLLPGTKVLATGMSDDHRDILECIEAGIVGCVSSSEPLDCLRVRLDQAVRGELAYSPHIIKLAVSRLVDLVAACRLTSADCLSRPTPRETQILHFLKRRMTNKAIAEQLGLSTSTVKNHVHRLFAKLNTDRRSTAVDNACARGWLRQ
jgi:DNA-binding NarL/FixJ family response regulator